MTVSAISGAPAIAQPNTQQSDFRQDFRQLVDAINKGDLAGAQQAYATITQDLNSGQGPGINPDSPIAQALNQIGQALNNNDVAGAQSALASLQQQARGAHHHHHHHGGGSPPAPTPVDPTSTTGPDGSPVNILA